MYMGGIATFTTHTNIPFGLISRMEIGVRAGYRHHTVVTRTPLSRGMVDSWKHVDLFLFIRLRSQVTIADDE